MSLQMPKIKIKPPGSSWMPRLVSFGLGVLAAASAVAWVLMLQGLQPTASVVPVALAAVPPADTGLVAHGLGAKGTGAVAASDSNGVGDAAMSDGGASLLESSRFALFGVIASGARGSALIAVDGKPAKPYSVGSSVGDRLVLRSVQARQAVLGMSGEGTASGTGQVLLNMPVIGDKKSP